MRLSLRTSKDRFLLGEEVQVVVTMENDEARTITAPDPEVLTNPEPTYRLSGPSAPAGSTLDAHTALRGPPGEGVALVPYAPGERRSKVLFLSRWTRLDVPGPHRLEASVPVEGRRLEAVPLAFELAPSRGGRAALAVDLGVDEQVFVDRVDGPHDGGLWLRMRRRFERDDFGGFEDEPEGRLGVERGPSDALAAWSNQDRTTVLVRWTVWRAGRSLHAAPVATSTATVDIGAAQVVEPPLASRAGELDVALRHDRALRAIVITAPRAGDPLPPARERWSTTLPWTPLGLRATIGPEALGGPRRLVALGPHTDGVETLVLEDGHALARVVVPALGPAPGDPAIFVDALGGTHVAFLALAPRPTDEAPLSCELARVDISVAPDGATLTRVTLLATLDRPPLAAVATFRVDAPAPHVDWVAHLGGPHVLHGRRPGPQTLAHPPAQPLQPLSLRSFLYLLTLDPLGGATLEPLR